MNIKHKNRLWFCSDYGIENDAIIQRLAENNENYYIVTHDRESQWKNISSLLQRKILRESRKGNSIYGIGLKGTIPGTNITNLPSEHNMSALEQVAGILETKLNLDEQFISAYAKSGINGIEKIAEILKIGENNAKKITENILIRNHLAMGVSLEQEAEFARRINASKQKSKSDYETTIAIDELLNETTDLTRS